MARVKVCCGDWKRVANESVFSRNGITGIVLDPPYHVDTGRKKVYSFEDMYISNYVKEWAISNGSNNKVRIALCGYDTEHQMPQDWEYIEWEAAGGYGNQGVLNINRTRECIWFSPACQKLENNLLKMINKLDKV